MAEFVSPSSEQRDELEGLTALYEPNCFSYRQDSFKFSSHPLYTGWYQFRPRLDSSFTLKYQVSQLNQQISTSTRVVYEQGVPYRSQNLEYLPIVTLNFILPAEYPNSKGPRFAFVCLWLPPSRITLLNNALSKYSATLQGEAQLWMCFDYIETYFLSLLELPSTDNGFLFMLDELFTSKHQRKEVAVELLKSDQKQKEAVFNESIQECQVCTRVEMGRAFTQVTACGHAFCKKCLRRALEEHLAKGILNRIFTCLACKSGLEISEVKRFATKTQFANYDKLLLQLSLIRMNDIVQCPRQDCGNLVWILDQNLATCTVCEYSFCPQCVRPYHPGKECERITSIFGDDFGEVELEEDEEMTEEENEEDLLWNISHCNDPKERLNLIEHCVAMINLLTFDSRAIEYSKEHNYRRCPSCGIFIEKTMGCSHMCCKFCGYEFLWY